MSPGDYDTDIIVVGGGIHGAGVAQAAAAQGYSVMLIDKSEIGSGTSSKSSKLIHGGLRYLESLQFSLVRSCLLERSVLLRNAPELVKLVPFYIPVYRHTVRRPWQIAVGLSLYHMLSGFKSPFRKVPKSEWNSFAHLNQENLQAVYQYYDAQTDDEKLTRAVAESARSMGAKVITGSEVITCRLSQQACEIEVRNKDSLSQYRSRVLVNAAGAAVNEFLKFCEPVQSQLPIDLVQGAHIVIDQPSADGVFYLEAPSDRRAVFAMPWKGKTLVGTTETEIDGYQQSPEPLDAEINYLLKVYNAYFDGRHRTAGDVIEAFAGLRVLPRGKKSFFSRGRDTVLTVDRDDRPRLVTIYGGKLTAYRATAEKVLQKVSSSLPVKPGRKKATSQLPLKEA